VVIKVAYFYLELRQLDEMWYMEDGKKKRKGKGNLGQELCPFMFHFPYFGYLAVVVEQIL